MKVSAGMPTGVAALFFESVAQRRRLEELWVATLQRREFSEVALPVIDYLDPYEMISGVDRDELYRFVDRDGEVLALRADFTPALARLIAPRIEGLGLPLRLFYRGDVLRYQEERAGRMRELYQLGGEILESGERGDRAEFESLRCALELLVQSGHQDIIVILGFAGALDSFLESTQEREMATDEINRQMELSAAFQRRERCVVRPLGREALAVIETGTPTDPEVLGERSAERLVKLRAQRSELAAEFPTIDLRIDLAEFAGQTMLPSLRRACHQTAYYDGMVFRAYRGATAVPVAVGGRYDHLFKQLGAEISAAGFTLGVDRLATGREERDR